MNRSTAISLAVVVIVCLVAGGIWLSRPKEEAIPMPTEPTEAKIEQPEAPIVPPPPMPAAAPKRPAPKAPQKVAAVPEESAPEEPDVAATEDDPFGGKPITIETLTGCKQVQKMGNGELIYEFAPDGEWKVNGNARAQWTIVGKQVKIYKDGTDEVHYVDIVGNKLMFNGEELAITR